MPPIAVIFTLPTSPLHKALVMNVVAVIILGSVISMFAIAVSLLLSITVTIYVPAKRLDISSVVSELLHIIL